jgi:hypothetical protein
VFGAVPKGFEAISEKVFGAVPKGFEASAVRAGCSFVQMPPLWLCPLKVAHLHRFVFCTVYFAHLRSI